MKKGISIDVSTTVYPLEAVYAAAYAYINRAYIRLDDKSKKVIRVFLDAKEETTARELKRLAGDFRNELIHHCLRLKVSASNQKIREYIVTRALLSAQPQPQGADNLPGPDGVPAIGADEPAPDGPVPDTQKPGPDGVPAPSTGPGPDAPGTELPSDDALAKEIQKLLAEIDQGGGQEDPLGIVAPWEEKKTGGGKTPAKKAAKKKEKAAGKR